MSPQVAERSWNISKEKFCRASPRSKIRNPNHDLPELPCILHMAQGRISFFKRKDPVHYRTDPMSVDKIRHGKKIVGTAHGRTKDGQLFPEDPSGCQAGRIPPGSTIKYQSSPGTGQIE